MKTAIFLGAGASAAEGAPIQSALFKDYFRLAAGEESRIKESDQMKIVGFLNAMFQLDLNPVLKENDFDAINFPTFEEVLGLLDLAENRKESFKVLSSNADRFHSNDLAELRSLFIFLMAEIIQKTLQHVNRHHSTLISKLKNSDLLKSTFFVSTNYDILIDNAILNTWEEGIDYGVDLVLGDQGDSYLGQDNVRLYKLHGSLNWLYCPSCNHIKLTPRLKGALYIINDEQDDRKRNACDRCKSKFQPVITPPTYYKDFSNVFLNTIWNKTERQLQEVEKVIVCGYSFPDADMHIKYLLKRMQKNRVGPAPKFVVINHHEGKTEEQSYEEAQRFSRFLGKENVDYRQASFEEFATNPAAFISD